MPESAEAKDHEYGNKFAPFLVRLPDGEGDKHVVAEPGGQGDVPATPRLGNVAREVGIGKVPHQIESKKPADPDGNVGIGGEVHVELVHKEKGSDEQRDAVQIG